MNYGKFNSAEELLKSYQNLQAAFTRRCQYIKLLRERAQNAGIEIPPLAKEGECERDILPKDTQLPLEQLVAANGQRKEGNKAEQTPRLGEKADGELINAVKDAKGVSAQETLNTAAKNIEEPKGNAVQKQNSAEEALNINKVDGLRQGEDALNSSLKEDALDNFLNTPLNNALNEETTQNQKVFIRGGGISAQTPPPTEEEFYAKYPFAKLLKLKIHSGEGELSLCVVTPFEKALLAALGDAQSLYQAMAHDEQYLESLLDNNRKLYEKALNRYAAACARSTPPVIGKGSAYPSAPPQKPKTLEEARGLIGHYIK